MKLNNIRLFVHDFKACYNFYKETLGLECTWGHADENYASFNIGLPSGLAIFSAELMRDAIPGYVTKKTKSAVDKMSIIIQVDNLDESFKHLQEKGVKFLNAPIDMQAWGIRVVHFRDPENNLIELFQELPQSS